ncbi:hypothetical protein [Streptosporangium sp. 'caverna']|nr:hypothetical protein [Streptosporangium sp. 'caverna']
MSRGIYVYVLMISPIRLCPGVFVAARGEAPEASGDEARAWRRS